MYQNIFKKRISVDFKYLNLYTVKKPVRFIFRNILWYVSTKIYDKRDDFDFECVSFPFLDGDIPRSTSY